MAASGWVPVPKVTCTLEGASSSAELPPTTARPAVSCSRPAQLVKAAGWACPRKPAPP